MSTTAVQHPRLGDKVIPPQIRYLVEEFTSEIGRVPSLLCVVLYGSAVRNELHEESDVDLFLLFDTDHRPELGEERCMVARICVEAAMRTDSDYDFSFVMANLRDLETLDPAYLDNVFGEGIVIWARPDFASQISNVAATGDTD